MGKKSLHVVPPRPDRNVIEMLEDLLALAKAGEIQGMAAVSINTQGATAHYWAGHLPITRLIGELEMLKYEFILERDNG